MIESRTSLLFVPLVAALSLAACGDDESSSFDSEEWCSLASRADSVGAVFDELDPAADPAVIESAMEEAEAFAAEVRSAAPPDLADDVEQLAEGTELIADALAEADYDLFDVDLSFLADEDLEERLDAAEVRIDEFTMEECGREFGEPDEDDVVASDSEGDDSFDPGGGTIREQLAEQFEELGMTSDEAACVAERADPALVDDPSELLEIMQGCGIPLERIAELGAG